MENKKPNQCEKILKYMEKYGSITQYDAMIELGVMRLASRISEMRKNGIDIKVEQIAVKNRNEETCYIAKYSLS